MNEHGTQKPARRTSEVIDLLAEVGYTLRYMADSGCRGFNCDDPCLEMIRGWGKKRKTNRVETLAAIRADLGACRRCSLCESRKQIVFGEGDVNARLVFVGEAPGYEEDKRGVPFVGAAGQLLSKILDAMHLYRDAVYICNIVKCRPPGNRNPKPNEIVACKPFLERQLKAIQPEVICALGSFAARTLLETETPISKLRGTFYDFRGTRILPTYHPAYLLRNPEKKRDVWEDMKKLMHLLGLEGSQVPVP